MSRPHQRSKSRAVTPPPTKSSGGRVTRAQLGKNFSIKENVRDESSGDEFVKEDEEEEEEDEIEENESVVNGI